MNSMAIDRRSLLLGTIAAVASGGAEAALGAPMLPDVAFVATAKRVETGSADDLYCVLLLKRDGTVAHEIALSARGHDVALHGPSGGAVVFARRPGTFAIAFNIRDASAPHVLTAQDGRHYYGHGAFSRDGRLLYASENDIAGARGVIGVYDVARGYRKIGEHPSYGVGPHEIILLGDGKTLVVANGGLDTVPDAGRVNLNSDAMRPSLTFVDCARGTLIAKHTLAPELQRLSLRHIAADATGNVWFGGQWEGDQSDIPQLIGRAGRDRRLQLIRPHLRDAVDLKGYIGSMAASSDGRVIAASAPKAGRVVYIDAASSAVIASSALQDACGIAGEGGDGFALTSGFGVLRHERAGQAVISETQLAGIAFDNHVRRWG